MEPERGDRPRRGGGRQNRRRPSGRARQGEQGGPGGGRAEAGPGSRGGGGNRGRSGQQHGRRGGRGREAGPPPPSAASKSDESAAADLELQEEEKDNQGSYSRRKVVSNWHRYEDAEKEIQNDSIESQRGTDFSVLLSSAGDSFMQFRFNEEKEWIVENFCPKQLSGLYIDCQSLVQSLEELPLHLKLNVAAELVQDAMPVTLPQTKLKSNDVGGGVQQQNKVASGHYPPVGSFAPFMSPTKDGYDISSEAHQKNPSSEHQEKDNLDEDFDLLLKLDAPANPENHFTSSSDTLLGNEQRMPCEEKDHLQPDGMQELCTTTQQEDISKNITEQDLEDWLDTMIS